MRIGRIFKHLINDKPMSRAEESTSDKTDTEKCVLCGKDTEIPVSTLIRDRKCYIPGCGQLCEECYYHLISSNEKISDEEM